MVRWINNFTSFYSSALCWWDKMSLFPVLGCGWHKLKNNNFTYFSSQKDTEMTEYKHTNEPKAYREGSKGGLSRSKPLRGFCKTKQMELDCWRDPSEPKNLQLKGKYWFYQSGPGNTLESTRTGDESEPWGSRMAFNQRPAKAESVHPQAV